MRPKPTCARNRRIWRALRAADVVRVVIVVLIMLAFVVGLFRSEGVT